MIIALTILFVVLLLLCVGFVAGAFLAPPDPDYEVGWIPASDPPDNARMVLVWCGEEFYPFPAHLDANGDDWVDLEGILLAGRVRYWRELMPPPNDDGIEARSLEDFANPVYGQPHRDAITPATREAAEAAEKDFQSPLSVSARETEKPVHGKAYPLGKVLDIVTTPDPCVIRRGDGWFLAGADGYGYLKPECSHLLDMVWHPERAAVLHGPYRLVVLETVCESYNVTVHGATEPRGTTCYLGEKDGKPVTKFYPGDTLAGGSAEYSTGEDVAPCRCEECQPVAAKEGGAK